MEDIPDFNKYYKELKDIHNKFNKLENDINTLKIQIKKKSLRNT